MNAKARVAASLESQNHKPSASAGEFRPKVQAAAIHLSHQPERDPRPLGTSEVSNSCTVTAILVHLESGHCRKSIMAAIGSNQSSFSKKLKRHPANRRIARRSKQNVAGRSDSMLDRLLS
jgi:hypothetical protein